MEGVIIRDLSVFTDERGWLTEIFRIDETGFRPAMSYISMTRPGVARGPHEHVEQTDFFCFFGNFRLYLWDNRKGSATFGRKMVVERQGQPYAAVVPPRVVHAYKNIGDKDAMVINLPDRLFRGEGKKEPVDEVRYENDPASPFRVD
ncbi:MAG: dTDP-4-dehydrorhamnose 3,5-epimerase family protein [Nitrospiraceae bacterium]|nr:dTDP-4-dehydrorhamnose 3,5-epimerase family protein [Nitrospiraceae bacterium]